LSDEDSKGRPGDFQKDVEVDKPGIVGARWWHQSLLDEDRKLKRRQVLVGFAVAGGVVAAVSGLGVGIYSILGESREETALGQRNALEMQKLYGWDFGARGVPLVFNGVAEGPFERTALQSLAAVMTPVPQGPNAKYHVGTLVASLLATPTATLPDPGDGKPPVDGAPFKRLADVLMPIVTPSMLGAYRVGEALARLSEGHRGVAALVDLPGPDAVAFAAGAAAVFEPVLLLDNWPHPKGVVPSHLTLAALAYYQPRFAAERERSGRAPLFVLDRSRLSSYSEQSDRFDNRYYARMPKLPSLAKDGVQTLFYVVASPSALPEPADLNPVLSAADAEVTVRAIALTDFESDPAGGHPERLDYGGSTRADASFWTAPAATPPGPSGSAVAAGAASAPAHTRDYRFTSRPASPMPTFFGHVPVIIAATSGLVLSPALDRQGSMNRFAGGWSG